MIKQNLPQMARAFAYAMISGVFLYLINNYLVFWQEMPGPYALSLHYGWFGQEVEELDESKISQGWTQLIVYPLVLLSSIAYVFKTTTRTLEQESIRFARLSAYIVRFAFWSVTLVGSVDMLISLLRVENILEPLVGEWLTQQLGRPIFRGTYVHYPLIVISLFVAAWLRHISFTWLALMCVLAEFLIVITRFVFSYEQAYMGDVVRFWYAGLFLFASAHTLVEEGHVRVDVLYTGFTRRKKALYDSVGCLFLGMPICWVILMQGMGGRGNSINSPLLSFEVSQSGYGMYVKYIMAGFLIIFSVTMLIQFVSYLLYNVNQLQGRGKDEEYLTYYQLISGDKTAVTGDGH
ncbi:MAG: TRAP transporter small permease subunit [Gammaproteobacteria bacterium]|nr:TRAP transporter small permease subunit [Gammaproteobacteria bacterium]MDH3860014.1 TRAP transporter small permease subunit [Gammaproteobacteria bacterium]